MLDTKQVYCGQESYPPLFINVENNCNGCRAKQVKVTSSDIPLSLTVVTQVASFLMAAGLLICGYISCQAGTFECSTNSFPDVSHVMGKAPFNKLYAIMLTFYALVKQAYIRAYHQRFSSIPEASTNNSFLLCYGALSCVFGPMIGFFDVFYNMQVHCTVVAFFVVGEIGYIFTICSMVSSNRDSFPAEA